MSATNKGKGSRARNRSARLFKLLSACIADDVRNGLKLLGEKHPQQLAMVTTYASLCNDERIAREAREQTIAEYRPVVQPDSVPHNT